VRRPPAPVAAAVVVLAAVAGTAAGAALMARVQDSGARTAPAPTTTTLTGPVATRVPQAPAPAVLLAWTPASLDPGLAAAAAADPAVQAMSVVAGGVVDLVATRDAGGAPVDALDGGWAFPLDALAIDPAAHAEFAGLPDRAAVAGLAPGRALLGRTSAGLRRLGPGGILRAAGGQELTVAAVVDDTAIGGAELAVDRATGEALGLTSPRFLLAAYAGDRAAIEARWRAALTHGDAVRFRGPGETPFLRHGDAVLPQAKIKARFGEFAYRPGAGDQVEQDPAWQQANLVQVDLPIIGRARCHRDVVGALAGALGEVERSGLASLVDPAGFAGCWNARRTRGGTALSRHAWGVAVDLNAGANPTGFASVQDPRLLDVFARWGFTDGSGWLVPDAGHFEYVAPPTSRRP
jgi:D-alanyl-D-alanine carboxypeptidase